MYVQSKVCIQMHIHSTWGVYIVCILCVPNVHVHMTLYAYYYYVCTMHTPHVYTLYIHTHNNSMSCTCNIHVYYMYMYIVCASKRIITTRFAFTLYRMLDKHCNEQHTHLKWKNNNSTITQCTYNMSRMSRIHSAHILCACTTHGHEQVFVVCLNLRVCVYVYSKC